MGRNRLFTKDQVLNAINRCVLQYGVPPTIEELRDVLGAGSTRTVLRYLQWLQKDGDVRRWPGARGLQVTKVPKSGGVETVTVPLIGEVPAGPLMIAEENIEGGIRLPREFVRPQSARFFLLRVRGDSMNRATVDGQRIEDGDLLLVRQQPVAHSGEIVVALIDGEATVKRLRKGPGYWVLQPESKNPEHQPIIVDRNFSVAGVVSRVIKRGSDVLRELWDER